LNRHSLRGPSRPGTLAVALQGLICLGLVLTVHLRAQPLTAQSSVDAAIQMLAAGQLDEGKAALVDAAGSLPPSEATRVLRMAGALGAVQPPARPLVARSIVLAARDSIHEALAALTDAAPAAEQRETGEGATLLMFAARLAEEAEPVVDALPLYERLVADHRDSTVWPEAVLRLSSLRLASGTDLNQAATDVENLIVDRPTHPLVPGARLLLGRLQEAIGP